MAKDEALAIRVMIVGGNFVGKGAEAMMLTVQQAVTEAIPEAECWVNPLFKSEYVPLEKHDIRVVRKLPSKMWGLWEFLLGAVKVYRKPAVGRNVSSGVALKNVHDATQVVVDVSGFRSSDQIGVQRALGRWARYCWAKRAGNLFVFMPQSWGPFKNRWVRLFTRFMLRDADLVYAREESSFEHLVESKCLQPSRVELSADIAFAFHPDSPGESRQILSDMGIDIDAKEYVVITPNMRVYERTAGEGKNNTYLSGLLEVIGYFQEQTNCEVLLVPHEQSIGKPNDPQLCEKIVDLVPDSGQVFTLSGKPTAAEVKEIISGAAFVVASRYHSLVAALSRRVPAVVIGWAHKYDALLKRVNLERWNVDPVRGEAHGIAAMVEEGWNCRDEIRATIEDAVPELEAEAGEALARMVEVVKKAGGASAEND